MLQDKTKYHGYTFLSSQFLLVKSSILNTVSEDWGQCKKPHGDQGTLDDMIRQASSNYTSIFMTVLIKSIQTLFILSV